MTRTELKPEIIEVLKNNMQHRTALALELGKSTDTIGRWLNKKERPLVHPDTLKEISICLNIPISELTIEEIITAPFDKE